jgi:hypothetical protein
MTRLKELRRSPFIPPPLWPRGNADFLKSDYPSGQASRISATPMTPCFIIRSCSKTAAPWRVLEQPHLTEQKTWFIADILPQNFCGKRIPRIPSRLSLSRMPYAADTGTLDLRDNPVGYLSSRFLAVVGEPLVLQKLKFLNNALRGYTGRDPVRRGRFYPLSFHLPTLRIFWLR